LSLEEAFHFEIARNLAVPEISGEIKISRHLATVLCTKPGGMSLARWLMLDALLPRSASEAAGSWEVH